ncbi:MAG: amidohydrolase family protein, partial [Pirellulales bacterium]|nr:amidohydrolase family protein [Pirellulales bacterium]
MSSLSLRARYVLPVAGEPIDGGSVTIQAGRIVSIDRQSLSREVHDLGNVALLPGLVNAHAHLDLNDVSAPLGRPGMCLVDWLGEVVQHRRQTPRVDETVVGGLRESVRLGTTTLADISQNVPPSDAVESLGLGLTGFLELIAPTTDRVASQIDRAEAYLAAAAGTKSWLPGLSPHAPYSVEPDLLARAVGLSAEHHVPLAMHLAESREEIDLIRHRRGPFREMLERLDAWDPTAF